MDKNRNPREIDIKISVLTILSNVFLIIALILFVILSVMVYKEYGSEIGIGLIATLSLLFLVSAPVAKGGANDLSDQYITIPLLHDYFENVDFHRGQGFSKEEMVQMDLFDVSAVSKKYLVKGQMKDMPFSFAKEKIYAEIGLVLNYPVFRAFQGYIIRIKNDRKVTSTLKLFERSYNSLPLISNFTRWNNPSDFETENISFNRKYQILSKDAEEGKSILNANLMNSILRADKKVKGQSYLSFTNKYIYLAFEKKQAFLCVGQFSGMLPGYVRRQNEENLKYICSIMEEISKGINL